ncbi:MAG: hypothetical protein IK088_06500 [Lachnospiraceae bacterium]|nr:hypothetical protein [Lachnospiraceae bacterium]
MAISRVEFNGQTLNAQNFTNIKHNEDSKVLLDQSNINQVTEQRADERVHHVNDPDASDTHERQQDASEKGKNEYAGDGGKNRRKKQEDGRVFVKGQAPGGFDLKV